MTTATRKRPTAASEVADLAARLRLVVTHLSRRMRQQADADVTVSQLSALSAIHRAERVTLGDLAASERVQPPSMTRIVASLEEAGLVERSVDEADRRVVWVQLTAGGHRAVHRSRTRKNAYLQRRLRALPADEIEALDRATLILERLLQEGE